jgi:hypothetical protein
MHGAVAQKRDTVRTLKEVQITGQPPMVTRKADRYIVHIENSALANGYNGMDVLQKSPGLWVSPDGNIRITGNQSVTVMINDIVQRMTGLELSEYLKTLRSEDISRIEVIANPPSEYEAASTGGIVHIILKKARRQGVTGTLNAQYKQQGKKPYAGAGASLDYKMKKWYIFGGYNYVRDNSFYIGRTETTYPDKSYIYNFNTRDNNNTRQQYRAGIVYDFSPAHTVNIQHNGNSSHLLQRFNSTLTYQRPTDTVTGTANTDWIRRPRFSSTTLSYAWTIDTIGSSLKVIGDYASSSKEESNTLVSMYSDPSMSNGFRTITPSTTDMYSAQADYTQSLPGKSLLRTGVKYVQVNRHNTILAENEATGNWVKNPARSDDFLYDEQLLMFYGSFEKLIHRTSLKAGLRGEQTSSKGYSLISRETIRQNYFGWYPSVFIDHTLEEKKGNSIHLNYARRVRRPAYNDLNPYRLQVNDFAVLTGNPNLKPQSTNSIQAGYTWHREYTADLYFKSSTLYIAQTARTVEERVIEHMSKNFPGNTEFGLSLSAPFTILKNWRTDNGLLLYRATADLDEVRISRTSISLKTFHTYNWKKVAEIDLYVEYNSPQTVANAKRAYVFFTDLGFTRKVLKNKGRIRLSFTDLFNTFRELELTQYNNTTVNFYQKRPTRTASLSFVWSFNAGKEFAKKRIDANNSDEKSRMGN